MAGCSMKKQVLFVHGANAYSKYESFLKDLRTIPIRDLPSLSKSKKWKSTFEEDLGDSFEVFMPSMPNKQNAKYEEWKIWFERHFEYINDGAILVGGSLGAFFLVKYLTENKTPFLIKALILLSAAYEPDDFGGEDGGDFGFDTFKVNELLNSTNNIVFFHSKDDPVVPYNHLLKYKEALPEAEFVTFEDKNHFLIEEFPELIEKIKSFG